MGPGELSVMGPGFESRLTAGSCGTYGKSLGLSFIASPKSIILGFCEDGGD